MKRNLPEQIRRRFARMHVGALRSLAGARPVQFSYWRRQRSMMRAIFPIANVLTFPLDERMSIERDLGSSELRAIFRADPPTAWALDPQTIDFLWRRVAIDRPRAVIECGAGTSTLLFTKYAQMTGATAPFVISLEQDADYAREVEMKLRRHGLERFAAIIHAPLDERSRYTFDPAAIAAKLDGRAVDWIVIDGPSGPEGCRVHTLPLIAPLASPGARWFLDDSFRDGEMNALASWEKSEGLRVEGIHPIGKGLGTGIVADPGKVASR